MHFKSKSKSAWQCIKNEFKEGRQKTLTVYQPVNFCQTGYILVHTNLFCNSVLYPLLRELSCGRPN